MGISSEQIAEACKESTAVDVNPESNKLRRKDNAALPELNTERKRDAKAQAKSGNQAAAVPEEDQVDADGKVILVEKDFDNP